MAHMKYKSCLLYVAAVLVVITLAYPDVSCAAWKDGVYKGQHSFVTVEVEVKGGSISGIKMLYHGGGGKKYEGMVSALISEIIDKQSVDVDAVTGATASSENLKQAVQDALSQASY